MNKIVLIILKSPSYFPVALIYSMPICGGGYILSNLAVMLNTLQLYLSKEMCLPL